mmetsp:Transcript_13648/g.17976  ORF Transcript_13648/g.17976 Transcript_13648/m.17976 type:complete len:252 (+) Transcript_13648:70-825(+)
MSMAVLGKQSVLSFTFYLFLVFFFLLHYSLADEDISINEAKQDPKPTQTSTQLDADVIESLEINSETLREKDPALAKFVGLALLAQKMLKEEGYATGVLSDLSFSPNEPQLTKPLGLDFQKFLILTVDEPVFTIQSTWGKTRVEYEVIIHFSKKQYTWPHMAILQAWKLDAEGNRAERIEVTIPTAPSWWETTGQKAVMAICGAIFCATTVRFIRQGAEKWLFKGKENVTEISTEQEDNEGKKKKKKEKAN